MTTAHISHNSERAVITHTCGTFMRIELHYGKAECLERTERMDEQCGSRLCWFEKWICLSYGMNSSWPQPLSSCNEKTFNSHVQAVNEVFFFLLSIKRFCFFIYNYVFIFFHTQVCAWIVKRKIGLVYLINAAPVDMAFSFHCYADYTHLYLLAEPTDPGVLSSL